MKVSVAGLWHLGVVTAACCASAGHDVIAFDNEDVENDLQAGRLPVEEPGLAALIDSTTKAGNLRFTSDVSALSSTEVLWVCYDTPVDENDIADVEFVLSRVKELLSHIPPAALILISSQVPIGSTARIEKAFPQFEFAYSPENLRLGKAIDVFTRPDRVVVGIRSQQSKERIARLFAPFTNRLEWMSIESAEMTKHAINSFLATSIAFINELATLCEKSGADALEVERGLKTDSRIGPQAYLHPGAAFAGGTLARDISFLLTLGAQGRVPVKLFTGVKESNAIHKQWAQCRFLELFSDLQHKVIGVLGLTYKPGTNTLRRSSAVEVCRWLIEQGATVHAFDPAIASVPEEFSGTIELMNHADAVLEGADAVLVATPWPEFQSIPKQAFTQKMRRKVVLDPARHLQSLLGQGESIRYLAIGVGA